MAIFLHILGIVGKVLLILLLVLLALLLLLLLVPFRYRVNVRKHGESAGVRADVSWLFHAIWFRFRFPSESGKRKDMDLWIFGIPVLKLTGRKKHNKDNEETSGHPKEEAERRMREGARKKPTVRPGERSGAAIRTGEVHVFHQRHPGPLEKFSARAMAFFEKIRRAFGKFFSNVSEACGKIKKWYEYLRSEAFEEAFRVVKKEGLPLLRHILPRKAEGTVEFGMKDPADTGMLLGGVSLLFPVIPDGITITPDFSEQRLEAEVTLRGRLLFVVILFRVIRMLLHKNVRELIRVLRHRDPGAVQNQKGQSVQS